MDLSFARAWSPIMHNEHLTPLEKLVLIEVCRYWPRCYIGSNHTISYNTGISVRHVQRLLKGLSTGPSKRHSQGKSRRRAYIDRGYYHFRLKGKPFSVRMIVPICLPGKAQRPPTPADSPQLYDFSHG